MASEPITIADVIITNGISIYKITLKDKRVYLFGEYHHSDLDRVQPILECSNQDQKKTIAFPFTSPSGITISEYESMAEHPLPISCNKPAKSFSHTLIDNQIIFSCQQHTFKKNDKHITVDVVSKSKGDFICNKDIQLSITELVIEFIQQYKGNITLLTEGAFQLPGIDINQQECSLERESYKTFTTISIGYVVRELCKHNLIVFADGTTKDIRLSSLHKDKVQVRGIQTFTQSKNYNIVFADIRNMFRLLFFYLWDKDNVEKVVLIHPSIKEKLEKKRYDIEFQMRLFSLSLHTRQYDVIKDTQPLKELFHIMVHAFNKSDKVSEDVKQRLQKHDIDKLIHDEFSFACLRTYTCHDGKEKENDINMCFEIFDIIGVDVPSVIINKRAEIYEYYNKLSSDVNTDKSVVSQFFNSKDELPSAGTIVFLSFFIDVFTMIHIFQSKDDCAVYMGYQHIKNIKYVFETHLNENIAITELSKPVDFVHHSSRIIAPNEFEFLKF